MTPEDKIKAEVTRLQNIMLDHNKQDAKNTLDNIIELATNMKIALETETYEAYREKRTELIQGIVAFYQDSLAFQFVKGKAIQFLQDHFPSYVNQMDFELELKSFLEKDK